MSYYLGIDLGTSYFKAGLFDERGDLKGLGRQPVPKISDGVTCELPVDAFWKTVRTCLDESLQMADIQVNEIKSASYSTQANSFILLDARNNLLTPLILWPDLRASDRELPAVDADAYMNRTGLGVMPGVQCTVAKVNWFRKYRPEVWQKVAAILSVSDFLIFSLTGQKTCDYSTAAMSGLFDVADCSWWCEQLENTGIRIEMLPLPQRMGACAGKTTVKAANLTGLPAGIPFYLGGLDHHMAAVGAGIPSNGYLCDSTGTVLSCVDYADSYHPQTGICVAPGLDAGRFFRMIYNENGARSLEWYRKNYAPEYTIPDLLKMAEKVEPGCGGLTARTCAFTYPGLSGFKHPDSSFEHEHPVDYRHGHYIRALMESTAHSLHQMAVALKNDSPLPAVVSSGGGSRSELWVNIKSGIVNTPFYIPECTELACKGAAITGALGINTFGSYDDAVNVWVRFRKQL